MMPMWMPPWAVPWPQNTAMPGKPACAPTACSSKPGVYEAFTQKLAAAVAQLRVGNGMDEGVVQGPLIDQDALAKVQRLVQDAVQHGARVVWWRAPCPGRHPVPAHCVGRCGPGMALMHEEIFGLRGPAAAL